MYNNMPPIKSIYIYILDGCTLHCNLRPTTARLWTVDLGVGEDSQMVGGN